MSKVKKMRAPAEHAGGHGSAHVKHRAWLLTPPWITVIALWILGVVLHAVLAGNMIRLAWGVFGLTIATVAVGAATATIARPRGQIIRVHSTVSVIAAGVWLVVTSIAGVTSIGVSLVGLLVGAVLALIANVRQLLRGQGDDSGCNPAQGWADLADDIKTLRSRIRAQRVEGATKKVTLQLQPGATAQDAQQDAPRIASALGVPTAGVRIAPDPDDASQVELSITPMDMLRHTIHWPGPSAAGQSIAEPLQLGNYEDGQTLALRLPGIRGRQTLSHILVVGMTGAGKSELLQVLVADAGTRTDVVIDYLDVAGKAEQTVGPIRPAIRQLVTDKAEAKAYLKRKLAEVPDRSRALAAAGMREWAQGAPVPLEIVIIDEGASLVAGSGDFVEMARVLRSVGVVLVLAIQRATFDQMPTSARENFGTVLCFGVHSTESARVALSDETRDAGAVPETWRNHRPGYLYCEAPGIDQERFAVPARAYLADADDVERILVEAAPLRHPAAGGAVVIAPPARSDRALADAGEPAEVVDEHDVDLDDDEATPAYAPPADLAADLATVDPDADLADVPGADMAARIGPPERVPPLSAAQAEAALDDFLGAYREATDSAQFRRCDLIAAGVLGVVGRRKSWLSGALGRRVDAGILIDVTGDRADGIYGWARMLARAGTRDAA